MKCGRAKKNERKPKKALEILLTEAVAVGNYLHRKVVDRSITSELDKAMARKYIQALQSYIEAEESEDE